MAKVKGPGLCMYSGPAGGEVARYVTVESNNAGDLTVAVIIQGEVTLEFTVEPAELDFGETVAGQGATASLRLTRNFGDRLLLGPFGELPQGSALAAASKPAAEVGEPVVLQLALGPDVPAATAILDRFLHHADAIAITGRSYRLKDQATEQKASNPGGSAA